MCVSGKTLLHVVVLSAVCLLFIPAPALTQGVSARQAELRTESEAVRIALEESGYFQASPHTTSDLRHYIQGVEVAFDQDILARSVRVHFNSDLPDTLQSEPLVFVLVAVPEQALYRVFEIESLDGIDEDIARIGGFLESVGNRQPTESDVDIRALLLDLYGDRLSMQSRIMALSLPNAKSLQNQLACSVTVEYELGTRDPLNIWVAETGSDTQAVEYSDGTHVNMSRGTYTVVPEYSEWGAPTAALLSTWRIWAAVWSSGSCGW